MPHPWHVIRIRPGFERQALPALAQFDGFAPMHRERISKKPAPLLTGYAFARWETTDAYAWHEVKEAKHILGFIGSYWPDDVTDPIVSYWFESKDVDGVVPLKDKVKEILHGFKKGDLLRFTYGWLVDHVGVCTYVAENYDRVRVNTGLLGRDSSVYVPAACVRRVAA